MFGGGGGAAGEGGGNGGIEGGIDEGMVKKRGRVLAICPVVRAPSGQGEKVAPWLTKHTRAHTHVHTRTRHMYAHKHTQVRVRMQIHARGARK